MSSTTDLKGGNFWSSIRAIWNAIDKLKASIGGSSGSNQVIIGSFTNSSLISGVLRITVPESTAFSITVLDDTGTVKMVEELAKLSTSTLITVDFNGFYPISNRWKYILNLYNQSSSPSPGSLTPIRGSFTNYNLDINGNLNISLSSPISDFTISLTDNNGRKQFAEGLSRLVNPQLIKVDLSGYSPIEDTWTYIIYTFT